MKRSKYLLGVSLTLLLTASIAPAQSLGDVAREAREKRAKEKSAPRKVFTNDNLPARPSGQGPSVAATIAPEGSTSGSEAAPASQPAPSAVIDFGTSAQPPPTPPPANKTKTQQAWQDEFKGARQSLKAAEEIERLAEDELSLLRIQQAQELSPDIQTDLESKIKVKQAEVDARRADTAKARKDLEDLEKEFKESGAPADWQIAE